MSDPFVAEIRIFPFNFAPTGWAFCDGQLMPISQNTALFSLLGTNYGGNGTSTFALPNLQGAAPMFWGQGPGLTDRDIGESAGSDFMTLIASEMPAHSHFLRGSNTNADAFLPTNNALARGTQNILAYQSTTNQNVVTMSPQALTPSGGSLPHNNMMPYLTLNFCIALQGIFPPRS